MRLSLLHLLLLLPAGSLLASDLQPSPPPISQPIPGSFKLLERKVVHKGGRALIFDRITPPRFTRPLPPAAPVLSAEELAVSEARALKNHGLLTMGATVYDREVTELHWTCGGRPHVAYSNIDFTLIAGLGTFETADTVYSLILGWGQATRASVEQPQGGRVIPALADFPADASVYFISPEEVFTAEDEPVLLALDALHEYFDGHRAQITAAFEERQRLQAEHLARVLWAKDHPTPPQATVIRVWDRPASAAKAGKLNGGQP